MKHDLPEINFVAILGDSLSDRGTAWHDRFIGPVMRDCGSLDKAPNHRFSNGFIWTDLLATFLLEAALLKQQSQASNITNTVADIPMQLEGTGFKV